MTTVEHAIPVPILYDDVQILFALSGTGSTPTHVVNYGGALVNNSFGPIKMFPTIRSII